MDKLDPTRTITPLLGDTVRYCPLACFIRSAEGEVITVDPWHWISLRFHNWHTKKSRGGLYAYRRKYHKSEPNIIYMHREIAKAETGEHVHHKNGFTLDNREKNLELVSPEAHEDLHKIKKLTHRGSAT